jgi:hypothetical protein
VEREFAEIVSAEIVFEDIPSAEQSADRDMDGVKLVYGIQVNNASRAGTSAAGSAGCRNSSGVPCGDAIRTRCV